MSANKTKSITIFVTFFTDRTASFSSMGSSGYFRRPYSKCGSDARVSGAGPCMCKTCALDDTSRVTPLSESMIMV